MAAQSLLGGWQVLAGLGVAAAMLTAPVARATTIDTFDFSVAPGKPAAWGVALNPALDGGVILLGPADLGGILTGSFSGMVEAGGLIELGDLTAFSATYTNTTFTEQVQTLGTLTFFSYNTNGGASSLDIAGTEGDNQICIGAAVSLDSNCTGGFTFSYAPGTNGAIFNAGFMLPTLDTTDQPVTTLAPTVAVPEPGSFALLGGALGFLACLRRRSRQRPPPDRSAQER
jgi:PEP-CTERM motif